MYFGMWYDACDLFVCTFTITVTFALSSAVDVEALKRQREYLNMSACCVAHPAIVVNVYINSCHEGAGWRVHQ